MTTRHGNLMKRKPLSLSCGYIEPVGCLLPHGSLIVVQLRDFVVVGVYILLLPHGILVHGGVGLGGGVVGRRDAVTGLAAVVAVPVVHGAVWILVWSCKHSDRRNEVTRREEYDGSE